MVYTTAVKANPVDDNGEAYYKLEGTDKTFEIRGTTHIPDNYPQRTVVDLTGMGLGQREYKDPEQESPVTLVITGSESYGYISSINFGPNNWMHQIYDAIRDRELRHIVMPGSHDAGMSTISKAWDGLGNVDDTQTQGLNHYDQLRVGARYFDMRLVSVKGGDFWAAHVDDEKKDSPVGATGEKLSDIINDINKFTSESPGEIIIWWVRYMVDLNLNVPAGKGRHWTADKANEFYTALEKINNRCGGLSNSPKFNLLQAGTLMDMNNGAGCVLIITDGTLNDGVPKDKPASGIYHAGDFMDRDDFWSKAKVTEDLAPAETNHMTAMNRDNGDGDKFLIMQWQCTPSIDSELNYGLSRIAIMPTNPALYWYATNSMSPQHWPTVIQQDYIGYVVLNEGNFPDQLGADIRVYTMGLNLYMVSQNCDVSFRKHPLLQKPSGASTNSAAPKFTGIIYANGTVDPSPPPGFHLGRPGVLKC
jgi:hypothetical protein